MTANIRLQLIGFTILLSAFFAVLVAKDPVLASAVSSGYVAILLIVFVAVNVWKKP